MSDNGLPGLRGTDHIGFTVPDLDAAVEFFTHVIGMIFIVLTFFFAALYVIFREREKKKAAALLR